MFNSKVFWMTAIATDLFAGDNRTRFLVIGNLLSHDRYDPLFTRVAYCL